MRKVTSSLVRFTLVPGFSARTRNARTTHAERAKVEPYDRRRRTVGRAAELLDDRPGPSLACWITHLCALLGGADGRRPRDRRGEERGQPDAARSPAPQHDKVPGGKRHKFGSQKRQAVWDSRTAVEVVRCAQNPPPAGRQTFRSRADHHTPPRAHDVLSFFRTTASPLVHAPRHAHAKTEHRTTSHVPGPGQEPRTPVPSHGLVRQLRALK